MPKLTIEGRFFLYVTALALATAVATSSNLAYLVFSCLVAVFPVSLAVNFLMLRKLEITRSVPSRVLSGEVFAARVVIRNRGRFVPAIAVRAVNMVPTRAGSAESARMAAFEGYALAIPASSEKNVRCRMTLSRRGRNKLNPVVLSTSFPLGLFINSIEIGGEDEIVVYPSVGFLSERDFRRLASRAWGRKLLGRKGNDEFRSIREYRHGDNYHLVHWKVSARAAKLMVRELEAEKTTGALILLDTFVDGLPGRTREATFENAVSFTATLAYRLYLRGYSLEYAAYGPELRAISGSNPPRALQAIFEDLAVVTPSAEKSLDELASAVNGPAARDKIVFVVTYTDKLPKVNGACIGVNVAGRDFKTIFRRSGAAAVIKNGG